MSHGVVILTFRGTPYLVPLLLCFKVSIHLLALAVLPHQEDPGPGRQAMGGWYWQGVRPHGPGLAFGSVEDR